MKHILVRELVRAFMPIGDRQGMMLMLHCYFDDSGTHSGARVIVWGGIIGNEENYAALDPEWRKLLAEPLPGKPPLKQFHLVDCKLGEGEFKRYSGPERCHVRYLFRKLIIDSGFSPVGQAVDVAAWDALVDPTMRARMRGPESLCFGLCCREILKVTRRYEQSTSVMFDKGREEKVTFMIGAAESLFPDISGLVSYGWSSAQHNTGLQAADVVANEFYEYANVWVDNANAAPGPHLKHWIENTDRLYWFMSNGKALSGLLAKMAAVGSPSAGQSS